MAADELEKSERLLKTYQDKVAAASAELVQANPPALISSNRTSIASLQYNLLQRGR